MSVAIEALTNQVSCTALLDLIYSQLHDHRAGASIGCLGAIAEFHASNAHFSRGDKTLTAVSADGALAVRLAGDESVCAYEVPSTHSDAWQYGIALLAPGRRGPARGTLTELGADGDALAQDSRALPLFDLGLAMPNVDYCVRSADPHVIAVLRAHCGETVVTAGHPLQAILIDASPTRVVMSPVARIEVYQTIARDRTPHGSHTHLLPDLLSRRRTHAAHLPLPDGALPLMTLHPENPVFDDEGRRRTFDAAAFQRFEALLAQHGLPEYVTAKSRHRATIAAGHVLDPHSRPRTRMARAALRTVLRQAPYLGSVSNDDAARG